MKYLRERQFAHYNAVIKKHLKSVRHIYGVDGEGRPYPIGTCVLLEVDGLHYIVTAAHVIDHNKDTTLFMNNDKGGVPLTGNFSIISSPKKEVDFDVAFLPLNAEIEKEMGDCVFLKEDEVIKDLFGFNHFMAFGYPKSRNKPNHATKTITSQAYPYINKHLRQKGVFHYLKYQDINFDENGKKFSNAVEPDGMSGGAIIDLGFLSYWESVLGIELGTSKITGIIIELNKPNDGRNEVKEIKAVDIRLVRRAIRFDKDPKAPN